MLFRIRYVPILYKQLLNGDSLLLQVFKETKPPQVYNHQWTQTLGKTIVNLLNVYTRISQTLPGNPGAPQIIE